MEILTKLLNKIEFFGTEIIWILNTVNFCNLRVSTIAKEWNRPPNEAIFVILIHLSNIFDKIYLSSNR